MIITTSVLKKLTRKSIIKISLSHSRRRLVLRPLITDVLLTRISAPEAATMATISRFLHRAIVILESHEECKGMKRKERTSPVWFANASLEFPRTVYRDWSRTVQNGTIRSRMSFSVIKAPVIMSSFHCLRAFALLKREKKGVRNASARRFPRV